MGLISGFFALLLTIVVILFAVSNRHGVDVFIAPFYEPVELPLYLIALGLMAIGFASGALSVWYNERHLRQDRRKQKKRLKNLEHELESIQNIEQDNEIPKSDFFPALPKTKK